MKPKSEILLKDNLKKITRFHITPELDKQEEAIQMLEALVDRHLKPEMVFMRYNAENNPFEILIIEEKK